MTSEQPGSTSRRASVPSAPGHASTAPISRRDLLRTTGSALLVSAVGSVAGCTASTPGSPSYCESVSPPSGLGNDLSIQEKYDSLDDETVDALGSPDGDGTVDNPGGTGERREFELGAIYWSQATGAHVVLKPSHPEGQLWSSWDEFGREQTLPESLRYPLSDQRRTRGGSGIIQYFQGGLVYWSPATGAVMARDLPLSPPLPVLFKHKFSRQGDDQRWYAVDRSIENLDVAGAKNAATSVYVPEGWSITVYDKTRFRGERIRIQGPQILPQLADYRRDVIPSPADDGTWSDAIASVKVGRRSEAARYHYCSDSWFDYGELTLRWAGVVNNGEGPSSGIFDHGPDGNLHVLVFDADQPYPGQQTSYPTARRHLVLTGPTEGKAEWDDGLEMSFRDGPLSLCRWRSADDAVTVFVYESDPDSVFTLREHNPLFFKRMTREETLASTRLYAGIDGCDRFPNPDNHCPTPDAAVLERAAANGAEDWLTRETDDEELGPDTPNMYLKLRTAPRAGRYHDRLKNSRWRYHQAFFEPRFGGYRLDWCRRRAEDCGTDAARAWAEGRFFNVDRIRFAEKDEDVGLTKIVGSGELCEAAGCDGFHRIALTINK